MSLTYNPTNWINKKTPLNSNNMNNIESGIVQAINSINSIISQLGEIENLINSEFITTENIKDNAVTYNKTNFVIKDGDYLKIPELTINGEQIIVTYEGEQTDLQTWLTEIQQAFADVDSRFTSTENDYNGKFSQVQDALVGLNTAVTALQEAVSGALKRQVVQELPITGEPNIIYMVPVEPEIKKVSDTDFRKTDNNPLTYTWNYKAGTTYYSYNTDFEGLCTSNLITCYMHSRSSEHIGLYEIYFVDLMTSEEISIQENQTFDVVFNRGDPEELYILIEDNVYEEYIYVNNKWEKIGDTKTDLTDYYTKEETDEEIIKKCYEVITATAWYESNTYTVCCKPGNQNIIMELAIDHLIVGRSYSSTASAGWGSQELILPAYVKLPDNKIYPVTAIGPDALVNNDIMKGSIDSAKVFIPKTITTFGQNCFTQFNKGHLDIVVDNVTPTGYDTDTTIYNIGNPLLITNYYNKSEINSMLSGQVKREIVQTLPTIGNENTIYMLQKESQKIIQLPSNEFTEDALGVYTWNYKAGCKYYGIPGNTLLGYFYYSPLSTGVNVHSLDTATQGVFEIKFEYTDPISGQSKELNIPTDYQIQPFSAYEQNFTLYRTEILDNIDNIYDEYMYINGQYELIGSTELDLSNYYTKAEVDEKIDDKFNEGLVIARHNDVTAYNNQNSNLVPIPWTALYVPINPVTLVNKNAYLRLTLTLADTENQDFAGDMTFKLRTASNSEYSYAISSIANIRAPGSYSIDIPLEDFVLNGNNILSQTSNITAFNYYTYGASGSNIPANRYSVTFSDIRFTKSSS